MGCVSVPSFLSEFTIAPPALGPVADSREIEAELRLVAASRPRDATPVARLANLYVRENRYAQALELYERATELNPNFAEGWLAAGDLAYILRDEQRARSAIERALRLQRYFPDPDPSRRPLHLVMLMRDAPYSVNAPLELLLDRTRVRIDRCYVANFTGNLPGDAVPMTAFGHWRGGDVAVAAAARYARVNVPQYLDRCARERLADTLAGIDGVRAIGASIAGEAAVRSVELPALVRPEDTHAGRGLSYVTTPEALDAHLRRFPATAYAVTPFVDCRSVDGYYRKYRVVLVEGRAYPYHLAISDRWMVHYQTSRMQDHVWMRREELAFLSDPASVFGRWSEQTRAIARAIGLDYVGLDVARLPDGTMLVFEADPAMLIHDEDERGTFGYKRPFVRAIRDALTALLAARG
jgi:tetratricopeptide (TPR) repeat protein